MGRTVLTQLVRFLFSGKALTQESVRVCKHVWNETTDSRSSKTGVPTAQKHQYSWTTNLYCDQWWWHGGVGFETSVWTKQLTTSTLWFEHDEKTAWLVKTTFRRRVGTTNPTVEQTQNSAGGWLTFSSLCDTKRTRVSLLLCSPRRTKPQNVCRSPHTYPHRPHCDTTVVKPRCKVNTEVTFSFWFTSGRTLFWLQSVVRQQGISSWFCCGLPVVISRKLSPHPAPNVF